MTQRSLFKEVAQRIVQSAQSSQNDGSLPNLAVRSPSLVRSTLPGQMLAGSPAQPGPIQAPADSASAPTR